MASAANCGRLRWAGFVDYHNTQHTHESPDNVTPEAVTFGQARAILTRRQTIKRQTLELRRRLHQQAAA